MYYRKAVAVNIIRGIKDMGPTAPFLMTAVCWSVASQRRRRRRPGWRGGGEGLVSGPESRIALSPMLTWFTVLGLRGGERKIRISWSVSAALTISVRRMTSICALICPVSLCP